MGKHNTPLVLASVAAFALLGVSCENPVVESSADYGGYNSLDELYKDADLVVKTHVTKEPQATDLSEEMKLDPPNVYTIFQVEVTRVFKGDVEEGQTIDIRQYGGTYQGVTYKEAELVYLEPESEYLLFLAVYPDLPATLMNPWQGQYPIGANGEPMELQGSSIENPIAEVPSLGDIEMLSAETE